ncbi:MAG: 3-isopropylmalate dehydratase small subunit, partial [Bacteroidales bacterium]|nr:3-isopropylmalate dehydratase small subunit [Bacteroidales bacterium]
SYAGVKAVICKSVNRIFYRSSVNQGLPIIILPEAVEVYKQGDKVVVDLENGIVKVGDHEFKFAPLPEKLMNIFKSKGLVNYIKEFA